MKVEIIIKGKPEIKDLPDFNPEQCGHYTKGQCHKLVQRRKITSVFSVKCEPYEGCGAYIKVERA